MTNLNIEQLKEQGFKFEKEPNDHKEYKEFYQLYTIIKPNGYVGAVHVNRPNLEPVANEIND